MELFCFSFIGTMSPIFYCHFEKLKNIFVSVENNGPVLLPNTRCGVELWSGGSCRKV